ncbi:MAG: hypothetical protein HY513_01825 [Candidatus Aenigmarchaeota archaeon]|nr:hypothetical protein [Candidatus Aenigmarchaeota archaeon]
MQKLKNGKHETEWVTISADEYDSMVSTLEILSSPRAMTKIKQGEKERLEGKLKSVEQVKKELGWMESRTAKA